jgi:hypothetical protein
MSKVSMNQLWRMFMKTRSPFLIFLTALVCFTIAIPGDIVAQVGQKAGQISRAIPDVAIARGAQQLPAPVRALVDWGDAVHTGEGGRARVALDDGSLLNVGSSSSLTVTQHNAASQQTQIELEYGRIRSQVVKQSKANSKFEIHTAVGVAGVVGTDFYLEYLNDIFNIVVFEGTVKFCNLDGVCVTVVAGQVSTIRDGHKAPDQPSQAPPSELTQAAVATSVGLTIISGPPVHYINPWWYVGLTVLVAVPAVVIPVVTHKGTGSTVLNCQPGTKGCG